MVTYDPRVLPAVATGHGIHRWRPVAASTIGSVLEWYDATLAIVLTNTFAPLYFPKTDPHSAIAYTFFVFGFSYFARPLGAIVFAHYGDRLGRKPMLITSLCLTGTATALMGLLPSDDKTHIWLSTLVILRLLQGVGVGGMWAAATLFSMECAPPERRGFFAAWPQIGLPAGVALANLVLTGMRFLSGDGFWIWGWRIPCLVSLALVGLAVYVNFRTADTPDITRLIEFRSVQRFPVLVAIRQKPAQIALVALLRLGELVSYFSFASLVFSYRHAFISEALLTATGACILAIPLAGYLSDVVGRTRTYMVATAAAGAFGFIYFPLLETGVDDWIFVAIAFSLIPYGMMVGAQGVLIAERFTADIRYSGASLGYHLGFVIAGLAFPLVAFIFYEHKVARALPVLVSALVSLSAAFLLRDKPPQARRRQWVFRRLGHSPQLEPVEKSKQTLVSFLTRFSAMMIERLGIGPTRGAGVADSRSSWFGPVAEWIIRRRDGQTLHEATRGPRRHLNAWIDNPSPSAGIPFHVSVNIGAVRDGAVASAAFAEPSYQDRGLIDLVISLSSLHCEVDPAWFKVALPRSGNSDTVKFKVVAIEGNHKFSLRVYLARPMILAQSLSFVVIVRPVQAEVARAQT
jgi:MFS family permease